MHKHAKYQFNPSIPSWDTVNFRVLWPDWPHSFLTMPNQKCFDRYVNLHQHTKNPGFHWFILEIRLIKKILQSDWLKLFWPISKEQKLSQIRDLCRNTANNIRFHYRTNSVKLMTKFFNKFQKPFFWSTFTPFSQFWGQK